MENTLENMDSIYEKVAKKMSELCITTRNIYLVLFKDGHYVRMKADKTKKCPPLNDKMLISHLKGEITYGVFATSGMTKLLVFDVDVKDQVEAQYVVRKLIKTLHSFSIQNKDVHTSDSGNKGYHIELFFNIPLSNDKAKKFFKLILHKSGLDYIHFGKIEMKPEGLSFGSKLGLGKNFNNPNPRFCKYVDLKRNFKAYDTYDYFLSITPMKTSLILQILDDEKKTLKSFQKNNMITVGKSRELINIDYSEDSLEYLYSHGLQSEGTRYDSLLRLAAYRKYKGDSEDQCITNLIEWMHWQDTSLYNASEEEYIQDIKRIVKKTYYKDFKIVQRRKDVWITKKEIDQILKYDKFKKQLAAFNFLVYQKMYSKEDGTFNLAYSHVADNGICYEGAFNKYIKEFEETGFLKIHSRNKKGKKEKNESNSYQVLIVDLDNDSNNTRYLINWNQDIKEMYLNCIKHFYTKKELRKLPIPRKAYDHLKAV